MSPQLILAFYRVQFAVLFALMPALATRKALQLFSTPFNVKVRSREAECLQQAEKSDVQYAGLTIRLYKWNEDKELTSEKNTSEKTAPKQALLVHGWEGNGGSLGAFIPMLLKQGYEVLAFDGPAHHASEGKHTDLFHYAGLIRHITDTHPAIDTVIAHSFGCAASTVALHDAHHAHLKRLVFLSTADKFADAISDFTALMRISDRNKNRIFEEIQRRYGKVVDEMRVSLMLSKVQADNVLIVHDTEDRIIPYSGAVRVHEHNPSVQFHAIHDIGHYRMLWNAQVIERVQTFLDA
jgi:pimeloyl-ACP methyl ester carboxylesterase